jgi:recombination protein RecR
MSMGIYPPTLENLIRHLSKLPGIGQKSATRVALYILKQPKELAENLSRSLLDVKEKIRFCSACFNFTDDDPCFICRDESRANGVICIVEGPGDQLVIEESGIFRGRYHVLHGVLSPLDGVGPEDLKISELLTRLHKENICEVIMAISPTTEGEATVSFLAKLLSDRGVTLSRLALGIPMGGDLKYMDALTLRHALKSRTCIQP